MSDNITIETTFHPEDSGVLRQVMVGMGRPVVVIEAREQDGEIVIGVETSGEREEIAALLYGVAVTLDPSLEEPDDA